MPKTLFLVCGEPSGEAYAARVARGFRLRFPDVPMEGLGSAVLASEGVKILRDYGDISVIGVTEALRRLPAIRATLSAVTERVSRPDIGAVLLVDFPDFNFRVGKAAARRGIPVIYYVPPQVWAWRSGRAKDLARFTKGAVVLFPFEVDFLRASGVDAVFAGHPILDEIAPFLDATPEPERFGIPAGKRGIGLLPGSRPGEVAVHLPILLASARILLQRFPDLHFALPVARPSLREEIAREVADSGLPVTLVDEGRRLLFRGLEAAMAVSGTVTLELALLGTPAVIVYRTSWLTYQVARRMAKVDCVGLPNIASGNKFLPELIQKDCTAPQIAAAVGEILADPSLRERLRAKGLSLRSLLRGPGPADAVVSMLGKVAGERMGMSLYRRMLEYTRPYVPRLLLAMLVMICVSALSGSTAFLVKPILDDIFIRKDAAQLTYIPLLVLAIYLVRGVLEFTQSYLMSGVGQRVVRDIREHLYRHMQSLSLSFYLKHPTGVLMSRVLNDVGLMQSAITDAATGLIKDIFTAAFLVFVIFYRDWKLALIALVVFPLAFWPIARFGRKLRRTSVQAQEITGGLSSHLQETISGAKLVKSFGAEEYEVERFSMRNNKLFRLSMKVVKVQAMTSPLSEMFAGVGAAAVIYYGGHSVVSGHSTTGNFFSFITALFMLYEPVKRLSRINNVVQQGLAAGGRVFEVIDTMPEVREAEGAGILGPIRKEISFDRVDFRYSPEGEAVLKEIDFRVPAGTMVAIVGSSGAGKTTLVDLIPRFYDPQEGAIRIDGVDVRSVTLASLREQIGIVSQHTVLFNDTIRNNIAYGMPDAPMAKIVEAALRANAHPFIERMPQGYETVVGEQGLRLSGGERQRLAIARALLKDAPLLILDEATSALDTESEHVVQEALDALMRGRTTFVIAHRLSTVRNADVIFVVEEGRIVERGRHEELLSRESRYRSFHLKQFEERKTDHADGETGRE